MTLQRPTEKGNARRETGPGGGGYRDGTCITGSARVLSPVGLAPLAERQSLGQVALRGLLCRIFKISSWHRDVSDMLCQTRPSSESSDVFSRDTKSKDSHPQSFHDRKVAQDPACRNSPAGPSKVSTPIATHWT